jgi:glycosyltransferase involved in cell wall biosynthesis
MSEKISACITAFNESANIRRCLESVKWADEIIVVDSFSTDNTVELCREYTPHVYQHAWLGYVGQKNLISQKATSEWILFVDADEVISPELQAQVRHEFSSGACRQVAGYWYPDYKLRLFRKNLGKCAGREPHDQVILTAGAIRRLSGPLHHFTYNNIFDQNFTLNRFSSISSEEWFKTGRRCRAADLWIRPLYRFARCYIAKRGFLDGYRGLIIAVSAAYGTFLKYAKLWELHLAPPARPDDD